MRAFSLGAYPHLNQPQAPPLTSNGELVAATPLGKDENGKNLVAYIVRTDDDAPSPGIPQTALKNANVNSPSAPKPTTTQPQTKKETSARFITPDKLLSQVQQEHVDQLRARDADVRDDATQLQQGDTQSLLTSFVYDSGPDGRRYAVGVALPLIAQKAGVKPQANLQVPQGTLNPYVQAALAYRHTSGQDTAGPRAGLIDQAV